MVTSEFEYHLITELITMPDRELAQKIELHIWFDGPTPQPNILAAYLTALKQSDSPEQFQEMARKTIELSGLEFVTGTDGYGGAVGQEKLQCRTRSPKPAGYVQITVKQLEDAERQEPQL